MFTLPIDRYLSAHGLVETIERLLSQRGHLALGVIAHDYFEGRASAFRLSQPIEGEPSLYDASGTTSPAG